MRLRVILLIFAVVGCAKQACVVDFQSSAAEATKVAARRYSGDVALFIYDDSDACRKARREIFENGRVAEFIAANFAAAEVRLGSPASALLLKRYGAERNSARIVFAADRLKNLRLHVVRLDRINLPSLLRQLQAMKKSGTIAEYRELVRR